MQFYEDEDFSENLYEMASVRCFDYNKLGILLAVNPDINHIGNPYFKMYNTTSANSATKVWRISFLNPVLIKAHKGLIPSTVSINSKEKKILIEYLNSPSIDFNDSVWNELKYRWNIEKGSMREAGFLNYKNGDYDEFYLNNPDYLPSNLKMPNYENL